MRVTVRQRTPGWLDRLALRLVANSGKEAAIGYPAGRNGAAGSLTGGASLVEIATYNNYGTEAIPRRAFMEQGADAIHEQWLDMAQKAAPRLNAGELTMETLLSAGCQMGEAALRDAIDTGDWQPNSPETIRRKKSDKPLIDKGDMQKYVTSILRRRRTCFNPQSAPSAD